MACSATFALTEPSRSPVKPPWPRLPTTSMIAPWDASSRTPAAPPSFTSRRNPAGRRSPKTSWTVWSRAVRMSWAGSQSDGTEAQPYMAGNSQAVTASRPAPKTAARWAPQRRACWEGCDPSTPTTMRARAGAGTFGHLCSLKLAGTRCSVEDGAAGEQLVVQQVQLQARFVEVAVRAQQGAVGDLAVGVDAALAAVRIDALGEVEGQVAADPGLRLVDRADVRIGEAVDARRVAEIEVW